MKPLITFVFVLGSVMGRAQSDPCNCQAHFDFVKSYMEKNHAAFSDNVPASRRPSYEKFCAGIASSILQDSCKSGCRYFIDQYLKYFRDHHIYIDEIFPWIDENDPAVVERFRQSPAFLNTETLSLDSSAIRRLGSMKSQEIEGIYYSFPYSGYSVAIVKSGQQLKGILLESNTKLWVPGQVKFILTPIGDSAYSADLYLKDHSLQRKIVHFNNGSLEELFFSKHPNSITQAIPFEFRQLNDSVSYIKVMSFMGPLNTMLDSCYKAHARQILSCPYLVIDVRDNGGGSEKCYQGLLDFTYSRPIANDIVDLYVTPDNGKVYQKELDKMLADSISYGKGPIDEMRGYVRKMQRARPYTFIPMDNSRVIFTRRKEVFANPRRVAIVYNRNSASACEGFILDARQSKKTITLGENSGGYTGYGNVFAVPVPSSNLVLGCTTTRYRQRRKYDGLGIPPDYPLNFKRDWLAETVSILTK